MQTLEVNVSLPINKLDMVPTKNSTTRGSSLKPYICRMCPLICLPRALHVTELQLEIMRSHP